LNQGNQSADHAGEPERQYAQRDHILEAGFESSNRPLALLLHGFPDLAYGWRHLMPLLADAGYHVVAPDQRGFGRTTGWING
jgi:pimeloyl-ACP methyl ester carboxylesterase